VEIGTLSKAVNEIIGDVDTVQCGWQCLWPVEHVPLGYLNAITPTLSLQTPHVSNENANRIILGE
jgi:hypothetical protein